MCGDCCVLTDGGATTFAVCLRCAKGGASLRRPWLELVGWLGAIVAGIVGSWIGGLLMGGFGPDIAGIAIIPALIGAIILALIASAFTRVSGRKL